jgi:phosphoribosylanthranilate isomerase
VIFRVKVCGITDEEGVAAAVGAGADAVGFNFHPASPRYLTVARAAALIRLLPQTVVPVGVFVNRPAGEVEEWMERSGVRWAQLHGDERPQDMRGLRRPYYPAVRPGAHGAADPDAWPAPCILVDAGVEGLYGGTGRTADWDEAAALARRRPVILAGGLSPENLLEALSHVRPAAVDLNSGVESAPGRKDPARVREAVRIARDWRAAHAAPE